MPLSEKSQRAAHQMQAAGNSIQAQAARVEMMRREQALINKATKNLDHDTSHLVISWLQSLAKRFNRYNSLKKNIRLMGFNPQKNTELPADEQLDNMDLYLLKIYGEQFKTRLSIEERKQIAKIKEQFDVVLLFAKQLKEMPHSPERDQFIQNNLALTTAYLFTLKTPELDHLLGTINSETREALYTEINRQGKQQDPVIEMQRVLIAQLMLNHDFQYTLEHMNAMQASTMSLDDYAHSSSHSVSTEEEKESKEVKATEKRATLTRTNSMPEVSEKQQAAFGTAAKACLKPEPTPSKPSMFKRIKSFLDKYAFTSLSGTASIAAFVAMAMGIVNAWNPVGWSLLLGAGVISAIMCVTNAIHKHRAGKAVQEAAQPAPTSPSASSTAKIGQSRLANGHLTVSPSCSVQQVEELESTPAASSHHNTLIQPLLEPSVSTSSSLNRKR